MDVSVSYVESMLLEDERFRAISTPNVAITGGGPVVADFQGKRFRDVIEASDSFIDKFQKYFEGFSGKIEKPTKEQVLEIANSLIKNYITPINIPYVPELVERTIVDPALEKLILGAVASLYDKILG